MCSRVFTVCRCSVWSRGECRGETKVQCLARRRAAVCGARVRARERAARLVSPHLDLTGTHGVRRSVKFDQRHSSYYERLYRTRSGPRTNGAIIRSFSLGLVRSKNPIEFAVSTAVSSRSIARTERNTCTEADMYKYIRQHTMAHRTPTQSTSTGEYRRRRGRGSPNRLPLRVNPR